MKSIGIIGKDDATNVTAYIRDNALGKTVEQIAVLKDLDSNMITMAGSDAVFIFSDVPVVKDKDGIILRDYAELERAIRLSTCAMHIFIFSRVDSGACQRFSDLYHVPIYHCVDLLDDGQPMLIAGINEIVNLTGERARVEDMLANHILECAFPGVSILKCTTEESELCRYEDEQT